MSEISEHHIEVKRTARYYILRAVNENTRTVWFVLHGFAQLAKNFISEFDILSDEDTVIIAPEGLSRSNFGRDSSSHIGASWMSKEDRLNEINDYVAYLDALYKEVLGDKKIKVNVLGFSQGGSTAVRWFVKGNSKIDNLFVWSSDIAKDVDVEIFRKKSNESKIYYVYGSNDTSYSVKNFTESMTFLNENEIKFSERKFDGGHVINKDLLKEINKGMKHE